jgi:hypothetical protein
MKFKFGKYRDPLWCTLHDTYMAKKYGSRFYAITESDFTPTKFDNFVEKLEDMIQTYVYQPLNWLYFNQIEQKISVKMEPHDTYSADTMLAHVILPTLIQLKCKKQGSPFVDDEDVPEEIRSTADTSEREEYDTDKFFHERWEYVINEMIFAFNTKAGDNVDWEDEFISGEHDIIWVDTENGMKQMTHGPNNTYKYDKEAADVVANRIQNGFRLFGKYYQNLWS